MYRMISKDNISLYSNQSFETVEQARDEARKYIQEMSGHPMEDSWEVTIYGPDDEVVLLAFVKSNRKESSR